MFTAAGKLMAASSRKADLRDVVLQLSMNGTEGGSAISDVIGHAIAVVGGVTTTSTGALPGFGQAALFNGTSGYLDCGASADYNIGTGDFCIEVKIRPLNFALTGSPPSSQCILEGRSQASINEPGTMVLAVNSSGFPQFTNASTDVVTVSAIALVAGVWDEVRFDRYNGVMKIYVGGAIAATATDTTSYTMPSKLVIGALVSTAGGTYPRGFRTGMLDNFRFTKRSRSLGLAYTPTAAPYPVD